MHVIEAASLPIPWTSARLRTTMQATSYPFSVIAKELSKGWTLNHCLNEHYAHHNVEFRIEFGLIARLIPLLMDD